MQDFIQFRDPIHGFIDVSENERKIIDSKPLQRLRNIKQLATTYLVYHGAEHTRFGHSLGVMHLASRAFDVVIQKNPDLFEDSKKAYYRQILRLMGLCHDLGHPPFSHTGEELFKDGKAHEGMTREILMNSEIADHIHAIGKESIKNNGADYTITPELIWTIYSGKGVANKDYAMPDFRFLKSFMDGYLDCDKMDYLLRDSYYCGAEYGKYDLDRLVSSLNVTKDGTNLALALDMSGVHAAEEFVLARYFMFAQVYFHKTRRYLDQKLIACLRDILPDGFPDSYKEYLEWDDNRVLQLIQAKEQDSIHARIFLNREVLACFYEMDIHDGGSGVVLFNKHKRDIERKLKNNGIDLDLDFFVDECEKTIYKIPEDTITIPVIKKYQKDPASIDDISLILRSFNGNPIKLKRIYVNKKHKDLISDIIE